MASWLDRKIRTMIAGLRAEIIAARYDISRITIQGVTMTGTLSGTTFTLSVADLEEATMILVVNGLVQHPGTDFTISGATLTMTTAPFTPAQVASGWASFSRFWVASARRLAT